MKKDEPSHDEEKPSNDEDGESDAEDGSSKGMAVLVSIQQPGYYKRMKAGYLGFTLFVEDGVSRLIVGRSRSPRSISLVSSPG